MSENRSSSGVRNLRAMFENQKSTSPERRDRSPNGLLASAEQERPLARVRSSFVSIDQPSGTMDISPEVSKPEPSRRSSTASLRRESFSLDETDNKSTIDTLKKTVSEERDARRESAIIPETVPEAAVETTPAAGTPAVEAEDHMAIGNHTTQKASNGDMDDVASKLEAMTLPDEDVPAANPDKPVSAVEEEPGQLKPSDPKEARAINGEDHTSEPSPVQQQQQPPVQEPAATPKKATPARTTEKTPSKGAFTPKAASTPSGITAKKSTPSQASRSTQRPAAIVTNRTPQASTAPGNSGPNPKTPSTNSRPTTSGTQSSSTPSKKTSPSKISSSPRQLPRKASRSSLTASTASSAAKVKPQVDPASADPKSKPSHSTRPQPKSPTQPIKISSHLSAPTASSAAKHDSQPKPALNASAGAKAVGRTSSRPSAGTAKPGTASTRSSMARANSTAAKPSSKPSTSKPVAADEGFLARMMRPTASSASKTHEKTDMKDLPKKAASVSKPRVSSNHVKPKQTKAAKAPANTDKELNAGAKVLRGSGRPSQVNEASDQGTGEESEPKPEAAPESLDGEQRSSEDKNVETPAFHNQEETGVTAP